MTLLFFDALQDGIILPKPEWNTGAAWDTIGTGRDLQANGSVSLDTNHTKLLTLPTSAATCIAACAFKAANLSNPVVLGFQSDSSTLQLCLLVTSTGVEVRRTSKTGTLLGSANPSTPFAINQWRHVAMKANLHASSGGSVTVWVDGVSILTLTSQTTSLVTGNVTHIQCAASALTSTHQWDDFYVCDAVDATATQGRANNDFLGDLRVQVSFPTSAGDTTAWTPSTGSNFAAVDETPPNTTDFVSATTSTTRDLYNVTDLTGTVGTVYAVRETLYATKTDSGLVSIKPTIKENSVVTTDAAQALAVGQYGPVLGTMKAVRPSDSAVWTVTDINALQIGEDVG